MTTADHGHHRHSYTKDKAALIRRLNRIEGQARGIRRMVDEEQYCMDVLQQIAALRAAAQRVSESMLRDHIEGCVATALAQGEGDAYIGEIMELVRRYMRG